MTAVPNHYDSMSLVLLHELGIMAAVRPKWSLGMG